MLRKSESDILSIVFDRKTQKFKYLPVWRNWHTHLTQNQAMNNHVGSSPTTGTTKVALKTFILSGLGAIFILPLQGVQRVSRKDEIRRFADWR